MLIGDGFYRQETRTIPNHPEPSQSVPKINDGADNSDFDWLGTS